MRQYFVVAYLRNIEHKFNFPISLLSHLCYFDIVRTSQKIFYFQVCEYYIINTKLQVKYHTIPNKTIFVILSYMINS